LVLEGDTGLGIVGHRPVAKTCLARSLFAGLTKKKRAPPVVAIRVWKRRA
jgi:hypothetical protein